MKNIKKLLSLILAAAMLFSLAAMLSACDGEESPTESTSAGEAEKSNYTIRVKSAGGMPLEKVQIYIYADSTLSDMKQFGETNAEGELSFEMPQSSNYAIVVSGAPKGYAVESYYSFTGNRADIVLTSAPIQGDLSGARLGLGDVMYDFTINTTDGKTFTLSEALKEKDMVLLNFWYSTCGPCATEFPYMEEALAMYADKAAVIALDPLEDNNVVAGYKSSYGRTLDMAACNYGWAGAFGIQNYPTTVIIDRYGVICLIEVGALTSLRPFTSIFETFTGDDYQQKIYTSLDQVVVTMKPNVEMDTSENISALINNGQIPVTYRPETDDSAEYSWPFIAAQKNGENCLKASNQKIDASFAILYADVELKAGEAFAFDYLISSELGSDVFHVIVDNEPIYSISGVQETESWVSCCPWVAEKDGTYEVALCYIKDDGTNVGDDTVYIKNVRVTDESEIDAPTYLPRKAASTEDGFTYSYVDLVYSKKDGYYHVGTVDGPLLLVDLMGTTDFNEESSIWDMTYSGMFKLDGVDYTDRITKYCNYASNTLSTRLCSVTQELYDILCVVDQVAGFDEADQLEWLKACTYYQAYGTKTQMEDPIKGLAPFSAYTAKLGSNNSFTYNRIIMPRGLLAKFVPSKSGVYRITSHSTSVEGVEAWLFNENNELLMTYEACERNFNDHKNVSMVYYMEAGTPYFIDIAFWDPYEAGTIPYTIEFLGSTYDYFRTCAPWPYTYDTNATGEAMYHLIAGGIDVVLGSDGYFYHDLGNGKKGSKIYCDFVGTTGGISHPFVSSGSVKGLIDSGYFDFSKTEYDEEIVAYMAANNNDKDATIAYLKQLWGTDYEANYAFYMVDDVLAGKYHGTGENYTEIMRSYAKKMISSGKDLQGCVAVDEQLAQILQLLMDKVTFAGVDHSWIKLCYYYDYLGR